MIFGSIGIGTSALLQHSENESLDFKSSWLDDFYLNVKTSISLDVV